MRWLVTALFVVLQQSALPPAYPRDGATKMLENERIVVWNIAWLKQQYPLHRHRYDLAGIYYSPGDRVIVSVEGNRRPVSTKAGDTAFQLRGVTHIEEGASDQPLRAVFFEMKEDGPSGARDTAAAPDIFPAGAATQLLDNERVAGWQLDSPAAAGVKPHRHAYDALVIGIKGETPHVTFVTRGTVHGDEGVAGDDRAWVFEIK